MLEHQLLPTVSPDVAAAAETLFQLTDPNTCSSFTQEDKLNQDDIRKIYTDLTTSKNSTDLECMVLLYLNSTDKMDLEIDSSSNTSIVDNLNSFSMNINSESLYDDEEPFDSEEWNITHPFSSRVRRPKLYEFLCLLLNNPRYKPYASWLNQSEGLFRIHKPIQVVSLWENVKLRKTRRSMDYDTFARGIRCYYKSGIMIKTHIKYTYRFA